MHIGSGYVLSIVSKRACSFVTTPTIRKLTKAVAVENDEADDNEVIDRHVGTACVRMCRNAAEFYSRAWLINTERFREFEISTEVL